MQFFSSLPKQLFPYNKHSQQRVNLDTRPLNQIRVSDSTLFHFIVVYHHKEAYTTHLRETTLVE